MKKNDQQITMDLKVLTYLVCADAYLTPKIVEYIRGFEAGFSEGIKDVRVNFMQSDGGLCDVRNFFGSQVCRYSGTLEHVMETTTAGITIQSPQLDIHTVAAGGGSRLFFDNGLFKVGPESAGAHPGPVCYKKGGYLTVTDANLVLGRILPEYFPNIFGPNADEPLDRNTAYAAMSIFTEEINKYVRSNPATCHNTYTVEEVSAINIAYFISNSFLISLSLFLSQGKLCQYAKPKINFIVGKAKGRAFLGITEVSIHKYSSLLSAYGIALANVLNFITLNNVLLSCLYLFHLENMPLFTSRFSLLSERVVIDLKRQGFSGKDIHCEHYLHMRYLGTDCAIMVTADYDPEVVIKRRKE
uniref:Hydantoinase_A domain-containing protein n=1 Tax=Heterorhabditis bacteriophora TaxID=37862 RepID=A0A1I7XE23_HETBA